MRCIFCRQPSESSRSVEHVIPESLGNTDHILPRGWVCDACNHYLGAKVEEPFLASPYGRQARAEMEVPSKKGRIPPQLAFHPQSATTLELWHDEDGFPTVSVAPGQDEARWVRSVLARENGSLWIPSAEQPNVSGHVIPRFIAKVGLEVLAHRCVDVPDANAEIVDKRELDEIRRYARYGTQGGAWPIMLRRIYRPWHRFTEEDSGYEVLHEFTVLYTESFEYYAVVAIFGVEYVINLGGPELDGFVRWLDRNKSRSPLYTSGI